MTMVKSTIFMLRSAWSLIVSIVLLSACQNPSEVKIPEGVLDQKEMAEVLADIHMVEGARVGREIMGDSLHSDFYYAKVYQKYDITKAEFDSSFSFYSKHPKMMDAIYSKAIEQLNKMEMQLQEKGELKRPSELEEKPAPPLDPVSKQP